MLFDVYSQEVESLNISLPDDCISECLQRTMEMSSAEKDVDSDEKRKLRHFFHKLAVKIMLLFAFIKLHRVNFISKICSKQFLSLTVAYNAV